MKTILVSDRINLPHPLVNVDIESWSSRPSVEGCPLVVLDLYFGEAQDLGFCTLPTKTMNFYELGIEVVRCLSAHGTVVAMVGPINVTDRNLGSVQYASRATKLKHDRNLNSPTPPPTLENSLDWLDQGFLESTRLDVIHTKPTGGISWNLKESRYYHLRHAIRQYWNPVGGVTQDPRNVYGQISHPLREPDRWDRPAGDINCKAFVLATGKHSRLPVSIAIDYLSLGGLLVVIPPILSPSEGDATEVTKLAILDLKDLCQDLLEIMQVQVPTERPEWVLRHRAPRAKDITKEITDGENRTAELQEELSPYDQMLSLIDGTGSNLVDAVAGVFDRASEAIRVELTEKAAPLDLFVYDGTGRSLAVEVTGVKGNLGKDDPHWADFLGYLPEHHKKNIPEKKERIVLVVNTFRDTEVEKRPREAEISPHVKSLVQDNHFCVIRATDLYGLWLQTLDGITVTQVFQTLFETDGIYEP